MVIAPGSRNAPLIIALGNDNDYQCTSVVDERAAAFTALGMTIENREPVAVICSSGSAAVNFYPAVVEAFYQGLPLIVITADRPQEVIDQAVGQTIRQEHLYGRHICFEANLLRDAIDELSASFNQRIINEAMHASEQGPVHINVPFEEPLYDTVENYTATARYIAKPVVKKHVADEQISTLAEEWNACPKVLILIGQMNPNPYLEKALNKLNESSSFLIFSETLSNLNGCESVSSIDRLVNTISKEELQALQPDLLITIGAEVVSKIIKRYINTNKPKAHWHLSANGGVKDTFQSLTNYLNCDPVEFLSKLSKSVEPKSNDYAQYWLEKNARKAGVHNEYIAQTSYSDLVVIDAIFKACPAHSQVHLANSTSVRYAQLFGIKPQLEQYANRGTSGIDGCTSTAIGHAMVSQKMLTLISGDIAFLYDSNAFWNSDLPSNFRLIVINNGGGNIFKIIDGPGDSKLFEKFQETSHSNNLEGVALTYGINFQQVSDMAGLNEALKSLYTDNDGPKILEVKTPRVESPQVLKAYFSYLKERNS